MKIKGNLFATCAALTFLLTTGNVFALPSLQLGPGAGDGDSWTYDTTGATCDIDSWCGTSGNDGSLQLAAYANATDADGGNLTGGNGGYAWDELGSSGTDRYAYLVVSAVPKVNTDVFSISVTGGTLITDPLLTLVDSAYGSPPLVENATGGDDIEPHGIYDTWFEVYEFQFDGPIVDICNTSVLPGDCSLGTTGKGYKELFTIDLLGIDPAVTGLHFDLFTVASVLVDACDENDPPECVDQYVWDYDGIEALADLSLPDLYKDAPNSHDAEWTGDGGEGGGGPNCNPDFESCVEIPEPATTALMGGGLILLGLSGWRRRRINTAAGSV